MTKAKSAECHNRLGKSCPCTRTKAPSVMPPKPPPPSHLKNQNRARATREEKHPSLRKRHHFNYMH